MSSIVISFNNTLYFIFMLVETIASYFDAYGLNYNFIEIITYPFKYQNISFIFYIIIENLNYAIFFCINIFYLFFQKKILNIKLSEIVKKTNFQIYISLIILLFFVSIKSNRYAEIMTDRFQSKLSFYFNKLNIFRYDNFYLVYKINNNYKKNSLLENSFLFSKQIKKYKEINNIYVIINESYPNFKEKYYKEKLDHSLLNSLDKNFDIKSYKKTWSKNYSTQGAELNLFCDNNSNFNEFKNKDLKSFILQENCWIKNFINRDTTFIHTYKQSSFNRTRYKTFFNKNFFFEDLKKFNFKECPGIYYGICDTEIIDKFLLKKNNSYKKSFKIFLTLNNHVPVKETYNIKECNEFPLTLNPQFCTLYLNQKKFNESLNSFLKKIEINDLVIFFSDTPPMYSDRDRKHFENYIDVFFFNKILK